jgi:hypothetical protein
LVPLQLFIDALKNSEVVFIVDYFLTPTAEELKDLAIQFYLNLNGS